MIYALGNIRLKISKADVKRLRLSQQAMSINKITRTWLKIIFISIVLLKCTALYK